MIKIQQIILSQKFQFFPLSISEQEGGRWILIVCLTLIYRSPPLIKLVLAKNKSLEMERDLSKYLRKIKIKQLFEKNLNTFEKYWFSMHWFICCWDFIDVWQRVWKACRWKNVLKVDRVLKWKLISKHCIFQNLEQQLFKSNHHFVLVKYLFSWHHSIVIKWHKVRKQRLFSV